MFFYQLKISLRNLRRDKFYSAINVGGLAISLAAVILTFLWVRDELNFNRSFRNADRIYQFGYGSPLSLASFIEQTIPEIEQASRTCNRFDLGVLTYGEDKFTLTDVYAVDYSFFSVFGISAIQGDAAKAFENRQSLVLTKSLANRIFKDEDPIGQFILSDTYGMLHVAAVIPDMPKNSSLQYKAILPFSFYTEVVAQHFATGENWNNWLFTTFALVSNSMDTKMLADKITRAVWAHLNPGVEFDTETWMKFSMSRFTTMHLYNSEGAPTGIKNVRLFSAATFFLLLIAAINYVNLVTARMVKRTKDAGVRKIFGANRLKLFLQMMQEAGLLFISALVAATLLIYILLPFYNALTGKQFQFDILSPTIWLMYFVLFLAVSLLAGIYPAVIISKFKAVSLFSAHVSLSKKSLLRKGLVLLQFIFSAGLILMTIVLGAQLKYIRDRDPGFTKENIFHVRMYHIKKDSYATVKNELLQQSAILDVTATRQLINDAGWGITREWATKDGPKEFGTNAFWGDYNMLDFFDIPVTAGQKFTSNSQQYGSYIINREMAGKLGWEDIVGRLIPLFNNNQREIIGEVANFNFQSLHQPIQPMTIFYSLDDVAFLYVKTVPGRVGEAITAVENIWTRYNAGYPFEVRFLDDEFYKMYQSEIRTGKLFTAFAIIAILISCLGLFGLVTYTAESKTKEIGIRKILGASVTSVVIMLTKEFLILVGIAMPIAFPLAYYLLEKMLQDYAYRIDISWWMFALAGSIIIVLTCLTVVWQAVKAATEDPVKALKTE